jgi:hypothetical protein
MEITDIVGRFPYRISLAGGWIDQPFVSRLDPDPPGSMVVASLEPDIPFMERCGFATSTRRVAIRLWGGGIPDQPPSRLVRELYREENRGRVEPSGSQDMIGLIHPGISRLDFDSTHEEGLFPVFIESTTDPKITGWLEEVIRLVPVAPRPDGYSPLGIKNLHPEWIHRLGRSGRDGFSAIQNRDVDALGASLNECMLCWEVILPQTVRHPALRTDLRPLLDIYQSRYAGAMYSGCGGGYLIVAAADEVPGGMRVRVRTS